MGIFFSKKSYISSGLFNGFTDIHAHILPYVDDGEQSRSDSINSLRWLYNNGVERLFLTPHVMSDFQDNTKQYLCEQFNSLTTALACDNITDIPVLRLCAEYMLEPDFIKHLESGLLTYDKVHTLVETSYLTPPVGLYNILEKILEEGYCPVLAHPERYVYMDSNDYASLKNAGIKFQLNILSLTGSYGASAVHKADVLLKNGYYDFAGSDFHNLRRHRRDFMRKDLNKSRIKELSVLFENNNKLWV
ncbi:MAG: hypothetical protein LBR18_08060 [Tannerella sp.]|nr:hypothetical protein [Tannerella sp.]